MFIKRSNLFKLLTERLEHNTVVALLGPRQAGKSTMARDLASQTSSHFFDLEDSKSMARLENPESALEPLKGLVIIDEIQLKPDLFRVLRVLADRPSSPTKFLILGSASPQLIQGASETLAGRVSFVEMSGFDLLEVGPFNNRRLWIRGGLPRSYVAKTDILSFEWRQDFITTFLERDIPKLGIKIPSATLRRFWTMLAHFHGQVWNGSELGRSLSVTEATTRRYLDILSSTFLVRQLQPWFQNVKKRQVKSPKIYIRDTGLLHTLLSLDSLPALEGHPKLGASWEGFALEQTLALLGNRDAYFWATHSGAELDLLLFRKGRSYGIEFKYGDAPRLSKSMHVALEDLNLEKLFVIYPGKESYPLSKNVEVVSIQDLKEVKEGVKSAI